MNDVRCISIVGLSSLESLGIRSLMREEWSGRIESFSTFMEFKPVSDRIDAHIVSADILVENIDFFLPRRQKTMIVVRGHCVNRIDSGFTVISVLYDEMDIKERISSFLKSLSDNQDIKGELSVREKEVLRLIAAGKLNKEIADTLCISVNTVITHRKNLSSKLGIKSASGLSLYALMNGLL